MAVNVLAWFDVDFETIRCIFKQKRPVDRVAFPVFPELGHPFEGDLLGGPEPRLNSLRETGPKIERNLDRNDRDGALIKSGVVELDEQILFPDELVQFLTSQLVHFLVAGHEQACLVHLGEVDLIHNPLIIGHLQNCLHIVLLHVKFFAVVHEIQYIVQIEVHFRRQNEIKNVLPKMHFELILGNECRLHLIDYVLPAVECRLNAPIVLAERHLGLPGVVHGIPVERRDQPLEHPVGSRLFPKCRLVERENLSYEVLLEIGLQVTAFPVHDAHALVFLMVIVAFESLNLALEGAYVQDVLCCELHLRSVNFLILSIILFCMLVHN